MANRVNSVDYYFIPSKRQQTVLQGLQNHQHA